ncbi:MAG TPA: hypothetical protein VM871_00255 [Flavisolibacter sp.]|nr:hypothetical protein [Flavisolibacter sp.]
MKNSFLFLCFVLPFFASSQTPIDTTIKVDLLRAPASPASNLLGFATSDIDRPTDVSALMLNLYSASGSLSKLPASYAVDIAPYWFFKNSKKGDITTEGFRKSSGKDVFKQTFVLSFAFKNPDSTETELNPRSIYGGFGFKFSLLRGKYDAATNNALSAIKKLQDIKLRHLDEVLTGYRENTDPEVAELRQKMKAFFRPGVTAAEIRTIQESNEFKSTQRRLNQKLAAYAQQEKTEAEAGLDKQIQDIASSFQTARVGFTWEFAGGASSEFANKRFDASRLYNAGIWTTVGYTDTTYGAGLFLARLLHNPDKIFAKDNITNAFANITTFDAGLRYIYLKPQGKFSASVEAIYRSALTANTIDPSWRLVLNAEYAIWANQKLTFSFGRNFDGTVSKDGTLIAALNFLTGFGNRR